MKPDYILFTDGSAIIDKHDKHRTYTAYSVVCLNTVTQKYVTLAGALTSRSIGYAEAWAIYQGLRYANHLRKDANLKKIKILVVSDSKLTIDAFTIWIPNKVWDTNDWMHWKKTDGSEVLNQDILRPIANILKNDHLNVRFTHINSHTTKRATDHIYSKFKADEINISKELIPVFVKMNSLADEAAHDKARLLCKNSDNWEQLKRKR